MEVLILSDKPTADDVKGFLRRCREDTLALELLQMRLAATDLRCRMIDISSALDALDDITGGERLIFTGREY